MADRWHVIEDEMLPESLEDLLHLRARLLERGYSRALVAGCLEFLMAKANNVQASISPPTKSQYRKMLASLREPAREAGRVRTALVATVAAVLMTALTATSAWAGIHRPEDPSGSTAHNAGYGKPAGRRKRQFGHRAGRRRENLTR